MVTRAGDLDLVKTLFLLTEASRGTVLVPIFSLARVVSIKLLPEEARNPFLQLNDWGASRQIQIPSIRHERQGHLL